MSTDSKINVSQSLLKDLAEYAKGYECGLKLQFDQAYKNDPTRNTTTDSQHLGNYFEYHAIGNKPRNGGIPLPRRTKATGSQDLGNEAAEYGRVKEQAALFRQRMKDLGLEIAMDKENKPMRGIVYEFYHEGIGRKIKIVVDAIMKATKDIDVVPFHTNATSAGITIKAGEYVINDLKCTGLLMDKYDHYGWHPDTVSNRPNHWIQPVFYLWVLRKLMPTIDFHFIWSVASSKTDMGMNFMYANIDPEQLASFEETYLFPSAPLFDKLEKNELKPRPRHVRCRSCVYKEECRFAQLNPEIWEINITDEQ